jgi:hypothetical protein
VVMCVCVCGGEGGGYFQAEAGVVSDSIDENEYQETANKAAALGRAIDVCNRKMFQHIYVREGSDGWKKRRKTLSFHPCCQQDFSLLLLGGGGGRPLAAVKSIKCSLPVKISHKTSNWGQKPVICF